MSFCSCGKALSKNAKNCRKCNQSKFRRGSMNPNWGNGEKILGDKNPNWNGGKSNDYYLYRAKKEKCASCGAKDNLDVNHIDGNHFNNNPQNWEILCRSCHMIKDGRMKNLKQYQGASNAL